ncbi:MAG: NAD-dependent epimerase/dehydratase family protein [Myxococcota bacterium]|nr:NAD-dependent epimerase/dehydratase family protein [Myxococcota bacterium]
MSTYLVTGATGFLGGWLARSLAAGGHRVIAYSRASGGDVLDAEAVRAAAIGCDGAFHCAGKVSRDPAAAEELYRLHVEGTKNVLAACARAGVRRVVYASTSGTVAVADSPDHIASEDDPPPMGLLSRWPYYRAKLFAERAALEANREGFDVVSVNPSLLLGPGDVRGSSTGDIRRFLERAVHAVPAGGLSFVDVRDAAEAMRLAMERGRAGERYLVGGCNLTVRQLFERLERASGVRAPWLPMPRSSVLSGFALRCAERVAERVGATPVDAVAFEMAQKFWYVDSTKAERELGWKSRDASETLYDTVEDLRQRGVVWP